ncbi:MAG: stage III sporulation protein AG, partial [Lachnospiraceae bacterium]|nr:stage III sporulation protein AG [Lachnospiraceae bacterium]
MKKDQLLILLLSGILLLVISIPVGKGDESGSGREGVKETGVKGTARADQDGYVRELEERLAAALSQMSGVGDATVMITLKSSAEKVIEKDVETTDEEVTESDSQGGTRTTRNGNRAETTIYSGGDSSG